MSTVLVVEDDEHSLRVLTASLQRWSFDVLQASTVRDAIARSSLFRGTLSLVLCDLLLPDGSGTQAALEVARMRPGIPVLFTSGTPLEGWSAADLQILDVLADDVLVDFLKKPFRASELKHKLANLLRGARERTPVRRPIVLVPQRLAV